MAPEHKFHHDYREIQKTGEISCRAENNWSVSTDGAKSSKNEAQRR